MNFTEFKFDPAMIEQEVLAAKASIKENTGRSDFAGFAVGVIKQRLAADPLSYRDYGPYWWALKDVLALHEFDIGQETDQVVKSAYSGDSVAHTVMMADMFRRLRRETHFVGTNDFVLDGQSGEVYYLFDEDVEQAVMQASVL